MTGQAGEAVPMSALAAVGIAGPKLTFNDLTGAVGKSSVRGRLALVLSNGVGIDGDLDVDNVDAATVLATGLGFPSAAGPWSSEPLKSGAFSALDGAVRFKLARAALSPTLAARDLHGLLRMRQSEIALENMEGTLAGGQIEGDLAFRRNADGLSAHGRIALAAGDTAALLAPGKSSIDGRLTLKLEADGIGLSPRALIGSLHGGGTITLAGGHFAGLDAAAFDAAIQAVDQSRAVDQSGAVDASKVRAVVSASMANSRFAVPRGEAAVTIAGGQLRLSNVTIRSDGGAELALAGVLDCTDGSLDARLTLSGTPGANALINQRPELVVALKGPFSAPNRTVDVSVLTGWLTLRAADQQARRLEAIEANRRDAALAPVVRPPSPAVRFAPSGTVIESPIAGIAPPATGAPGARALDRLKPEAPADDSRPDAGNPDQGVNRLPALPPPAEIKPLFPQPQRAPSRADNTGGVTGDQVTTEPPRRRPVVRQPAPAATERPPLDLLFRPQH
jgi:large subunit ribosomal protein L24